MNQNEINAQVVANFFQAVLLPIVAATAIVLPMIFLLGKGMLWGKKEG